MYRSLKGELLSNQILGVERLWTSCSSQYTRETIGALLKFSLYNMRQNILQVFRTRKFDFQG